MGVSPWKTPYQLWRQKVGLDEDDFENDAMRRGKELEERARQTFCSEIGIDLRPEVLTHRRYDWMIASFDGIDAHKTVAVEIKCPGRHDHQKALDGQVPDKYYAQLQHQMEVAGLDQIYYYSYDGVNGVMLTVKKDIPYIIEMLKKHIEFYFHMEDLTEPDLSERDYQRRNDDEWMSAVAEWKKAHDHYVRYENEEKIARQKLMEMSSGRNCQGGGIKVLHGIRKGSIDYKNVPLDKQSMLEVYRREPVKFSKIISMADYV